LNGPSSRTVAVALPTHGIEKVGVAPDALAEEANT
jgi:hypothetical protein